MAEDAVSVHRLPSGVALELTSLACVTPSICSNVAVTYLDRVHASDASNQKIAAAQSCMSHWLAVDKRGSHTHLGNDLQSWSPATD